MTKSVGDSLKKLIKPQRDLPHPKVLASLDWTDLLPRNEVVTSLSLNPRAIWHITHSRGYTAAGSCCHHLLELTSAWF